MKKQSVDDWTISVFCNLFVPILRVFTGVVFGNKEVSRPWESWFASRSESYSHILIFVLYGGITTWWQVRVKTNFRVIAWRNLDRRTHDYQSTFSSTGKEYCACLHFSYWMRIFEKDVGVRKPKLAFFIWFDAHKFACLLECLLLSDESHPFEFVGCWELGMLELFSSSHKPNQAKPQWEADRMLVV